MKKSRLLGAVCAFLISVIPTFTFAAVINVLQVGGHTSSWNDGSFNVTNMNTTTFATQSLIGFDVLYIDASAFDLATLLARSSDISTFVSNGGGLITDSGGNYSTADFSWVPHASSLSWVTEHQNSVLLTSLGMSHAVTAGLTNTDLSGWGNSQHNYFTATAGLDVLTTSPSGYANSLVGDYGSGRVIYFGVDPTYHQGIGGTNQLIRQAVGWASEGAVMTTVVPIPAAVWLFGSGLLGLVGIARRKKPA